MSAGAAMAEAAANFIGVRFRLHGRDAASGLDCVGLVSAALTMIGREPLSLGGYSLRNSSIDHWMADAARSGLVRITGQVQLGDVLLISPSPLQHHLMIAGGASRVIHAHAGLRRVVREPLPAIAAAAHWRP